MSLTQLFVAALAALSVVDAKPFVWDKDPIHIEGANNNYGKPSSTTAVVSKIATATSPPSPPASPPPAADNTELIEKLLTAPSSIRRFQRLLTNKGEKLLDAEELKPLTVFDFNNAKPNAGAKGGATKSASIETFPILTGLGISTTVGFIKPCGMNSPHVHPRATEFLTVVEGKMSFGYILENGLVKPGNKAEISGTLNKFQGTVFPMGSIHYQINEDCVPATFVASLNGEDPGTSTIAPNFFGLNKNVVSATLGFPESLNGKDIESFRADIPANIALSIDECLKKCNIDPKAPATP